MARILSSADVQRCLTMPETIEMMRVAFTALSNGQAQTPPRTTLALPEQGVALFMPSLLQTEQQNAFGLKIITVVPQNSFRGLPRSYASVLLFDAHTGRTLAVMEGRWLTAMRTGAASGLATALLARPDAALLALFGAGAQAVTQALALHTVRPLRAIRVVNRSDEHYQDFVIRLQELLGAHCPPIVRAASAREALTDALLVVCATAAHAPLFAYEDVMPGAHINAIGAFTPQMCEVGPDTLAHAHLVVDQREAAAAEAGDLLQAYERGMIAPLATLVEIGELLSGKATLKRQPTDLTCFKSVGVAVQDVAIALHVYQRACAMHIGIEVAV